MKTMQEGSDWLLAAVSDFSETQYLEVLTATPSNAEVSLSVETASPSNASQTLAEGKLYSASEGSSDVTNLRVPTLGYDDTSITLVWDKRLLRISKR